MQSMNYQFHADPHELLFDLLPTWLDGHAVFLAAENFSLETRFFLAEGNDLHAAEDELGTIFRVFVRTSPFSNDPAGKTDFLESNPDFFVVHPGRLDAVGLKESSIGAYVNDPQSYSVMKSVITRAKRSMHRGATVIGGMGGRAEIKHHGFSEGALALYVQGVPIRGMGGGTRYEFTIPC